MNSKNKVILYSVIFGFILYILDALIYYLVFSQDYSFLEVFITSVPLSEIYNRLLMMVGLIIFGFIVSGILSDLYLENNFLKHQAAGAASEKIDADFISSFSYQLRTPLNAIVGFSELLKDPNLSAQSKQTYVNHIYNSGNYLLQLLDNMDDISKIESNQFNINKTTFNLNDLLDEVLDYFQKKKLELGRKDVILRLEKGISSMSYDITTDKGRFRQVLFNLLENAFKHTEEGMVVLGYKIKEDNLLEFYVKDTGQGFSMERLETIFKRYKRLSDNQNQPFDVAALRLTITKSLVKLLGGNIWANSKLGHGSTFYFTLPFESSDNDGIRSKADEEDTGKVSLGQESENIDLSKFTILIAEDVESNYIYLRELLKQSKVNLVWAMNGEEAVKQVKSNPKINLVLMDVLMTGMDGYEAAQKIKELRPNLPVIAQTAYSLEGEMANSEQQNFDDFLVKPIWAPKLMSTVLTHLK